MLILKFEEWGSVYTLDPDTNELYYAPIYQDDTVNLNEFAPVDLDCLDEEDQQQVLKIQQQLISIK
jgi:hypothetical protein